MNKLFGILNKTGKIIIILIIFILAGFGIYKIIDILIHPPLYIVIQFEDLGPIYKRMPVYYKGYKIGITKKIEPSKDYKSTLVTINFYPKELKLPDNTTAKVKTLNTGLDYIELLYPQNPSNTLLITGSIIEGKTSMDIQSFMSAQAESGNLGNIIDSSAQTLNSITETSNKAGKLLVTITDTVNENRKSIKISTNNLALATSNLNNITENIKNSLSDGTLNNTTKNVEEITENMKILTKNLNQTVKITNSALCELNGTAKNLNSTTKDIEKSIKKRKGIMGFILGKKE